MASEDVIELGSSDDEAQPAPKKPKQNAMVHIPGKKFHGLTIKPTMKPKMPPKQVSVKPSANMKPLVVGKGITLTKIRNGCALGKPGLLVSQKPQNGPPVNKFKPVSVPVINPFRLAKNIQNLQIKKQTNNIPVIINKNLNTPNTSKVATDIYSLTKLPSSITVTRAVPKKRPTNLKVGSVRKKQKIVSQVPKPVLTVDLDDDEGPETSKASSVAPWYLPPDSQPDENKMEKGNNEEPDTRKFIEITIEDSPIKPALNKRTCEVGAELAITIDDSPVKNVTQVSEDGSDNELNTASPKTPNSKKRLEYPKETLTRIEIEIEPMEVGDGVKISSEENLKTPVTIPIEIQDSPVKKSTSSPKKGESSEKAVQSEISEFHPVYQSFIDLCFKLEDSEDMRKIVDKKIKGYYKQVPKEYTESEEFIDMVSSKIISMKVGPEKMYLYIKDIVDELNMQRKMAKTQVIQKENKNTEPEPFIYGENSEFDTKRQRQIRKLEKTLKKLHRAIQKLEEQEVDFDDEEDSVYLLTERYKERMVRVHAKLCQLTNTKMPSEPRVHIDARSGQPSGPAKRLEKWINKKVPIGTPLPFPDFHDVLRCVREANEEDKLGWNEVDVMEEARDLFVRCGKKLQRRRQENEWRLAASRISDDIDPVVESDLLKKKLDENRLVASKRETEVFNKYADRQSQLKLEAVEIGDKEAEESPVESDDEEPNEEESTLENKEKRKERLKRLIQEKSKKTEEQTENKENNENQETEGVLEEKQEEAIKQTDSIEPQINDAEKEQNSKDSEKINNESNAEHNHVEVHFIDSDDNKVDSDVDELHLLQKLHSENEENSSTIESSGSDTPIDISDTLQSSSDNKGKPSRDVISIENSSYSESEVNDANNCKEIVETADKIVDATEEIELSCTPPEKRTVQNNNEEYEDSIENILLASSDDENQNDDQKNDDENMSKNEDSVNLRDDAISIGDTEIGECNTKYKSPIRDVDENLVSPDNDSITMIEDTTDVNDAKMQSKSNGSIDKDKVEAVIDSSSEMRKDEEVSDNSVKKTEQDSPSAIITQDSPIQLSIAVKENNGHNVASQDSVEIGDNSNESNANESLCDETDQIDKAKPEGKQVLDNVNVNLDSNDTLITKTVDSTEKASVIL